MSQWQHFYINKTLLNLQTSRGWMHPCKMDGMDGVQFPLRVKTGETGRQFQLALLACRQFLWSMCSRVQLVNLHCSIRGGDSPSWNSSQLVKSHICYCGSDWTSTALMHEIRPSYLYNVVCILFSPVPAPQLHPSVQWAPPGAGLCAKQVILWIEMMGGPQAYLSWDQPVHVPVHCHAMDVPSCMNII